MKSTTPRIFFIFACFLALLGVNASAQTVNPKTDIRWPASCTGTAIYYNIVTGLCTIPPSGITSISIATSNGFQGSSSGGLNPTLTLSVDSTHVLPVNTGLATTYLNGAGTYTTPPGGGGTVNSISVATSNGFQGSSSGGPTPILTLSLDSTHVLPVNTNLATTFLNGAGFYTTPPGTPLPATVMQTNQNETFGTYQFNLANSTLLTLPPTVTVAGKVINQPTSSGTYALTSQLTTPPIVINGIDDSLSGWKGVCAYTATAIGTWTGITNTITVSSVAGTIVGGGSQAVWDGGHSAVSAAVVSIVGSTVVLTTNTLSSQPGGIQLYFGCNPGGDNVPGATAQTVGNPTPSIDGASMLVSLTTLPVSTQTNALWVYEAGACDSCTNVTSDFEIYINNGAAADNMEFDSFIFDHTDLLDFMWGTQCNQTLGVWQYANNSSPWQSTTAACNLTSGTWHHIIETFHRVPGDTSCGGMPCEYWDDITVDGVVNHINATYTATNLYTNWASGSGLQFQIDIPASTGTAITVSENLDQILFQESPTAGYCQIAGCTMSGPFLVPTINGLSVTNIGIGAGSVNLGGSLTAFSSGTGNLAVGPGVLNSNTTGSNNVGVGQGALYVNTSGTNNVAVGLNSLNSNTTGGGNTAVGQGVLVANTTGGANTGIGKNSLTQNTLGGGNTAIGYQAGFNLSTPLTNNNASTFIGENANTSVDALSNVTVIGYNAQATTSNTIMIGNSAVTAMCWAGGRACWYSSSGLPSSALCTVSNIGSIYSNTDGSSPTTTLYMCTSAGTWTASATGGGTTSTICSGSFALSTALIAAGGDYLNTQACTGLLSTDTITLDFNLDPTSTVGFIPGSGAILSLYKFPTAGTINVYQVNNTASSITPGAVTVNYRVYR